MKSVATAVIEGIRAGFISSVDGNVDLLREGGTAGSTAGSSPSAPIAPTRWRSPASFPRTAPHPPNLSPPSWAFGPRTSTPTARAGDIGPRLADHRRGAGFGRPTRVAAPNATTEMPQLHELAHPADSSPLDASFGRRSSSQTPDTFTLRLRGADEHGCQPRHGEPAPRPGPPGVSDSSFGWRRRRSSVRPNPSVWLVSRISSPDPTSRAGDGCGHGRPPRST